MTKEQKQQVKKLWLQLSLYYQTQMKDEIFEMYVQDVEDLDFDLVVRELGAYRRNPKHFRPPLPAHIRAALDSGSIDPDIAARESVSLLLSAITKFGYIGHDQAKEYVGELGWLVVERHGGWSRLCQQMGASIDPNIFQAQARELIKSQITFSKMGVKDYKPTLAAPERKLLR